MVDRKHREEQQRVMDRRPKNAIPSDLLPTGRCSLPLKFPEVQRYSHQMRTIHSVHESAEDTQKSNHNNKTPGDKINTIALGGDTKEN